MVSFGSVDRLTMAAWFFLLLVVDLAFVFPDKCYVSTLKWSIGGLGASSSVGSYVPVRSFMCFNLLLLLLLETEYFKKCIVPMLSTALWLDLILSFPCLITRQLFLGTFLSLSTARSLPGSAGAILMCPVTRWQRLCWGFLLPLLRLDQVIKLCWVAAGCFIICSIVPERQISFK